MKHINKLAKRFLAFAMIVIMLGGMVPGSAFAQEQPAAEESITGLSAYLEWTAVEEQKNGSDPEPAPAPEDAEELALGTGEAEKREIGVVEGEDDGLTEYVYQVHVMLTENGAEREVVYQQNEDGLYPYNVDWGNAAQGEANGNTFRTAGAVTASVSYDGVYLSVKANASGVSGITEKTTAALREDVGQTTLYLPAEGSAETAEPFELQGCFGANVTGGMTVDAPSDDSIAVDGTKVTPQKVTGNAASVVVRIKGASGRVYAKQTYSFMVQEKSAIMLSGTMGENGWYRSPVTATVTYEKKGEETVPNAVVTNTDTNAESECPLVSEDGATYTAVLRFGSSADASEGGTPASGKASFSDGEYTIAFSGAKNATLKVDTLAPEMQENSFSVSCKGKETTATICLRDALSGLATVEAAFSADGESWEAAEAATSTDQSENQASDAYTTYSVTADQAYPYVRFTVKDQAGNEVTFDNVDRPAMSCELVYPSTWEKKTGDPIYFDQEQTLKVIVSNAEGFDASNSYVTIDGTNYFCWNTDPAAKTAAMTICLSDKDETEGAVKLGSLRTISLHAVAASGSLDQVLRGENEPTAIVDTKNPTLTLFAAYGDNVACDVITRGENVYVVVDPVADAPDAEKPTETKITLVGTISDEHFKAPENWFADNKIDVQWKAEEKTFTYSQTVQAGETVELRLPDCVFEDLAGRKLESAVILGKADESGLQSSQMLAVDETTGKLTGKVYVGCAGSDKPDQDQSAPTIGITDDKANKFKTINNVPVYNTVGEIKFMVDVKDDASGLASVEYWCDGEEHKTLEPDALVITLPVPENTECDRKLHVRATDNAGNSREVAKSFAIDTWAPRITVTAVSAQPANEVGDVLYYQNGVTYTVSIEDKYLDTHKISATVNDNELEETTIKLMNDGDKLTRLTAEATDRLGHKANWDKLAGKTVVVDRTNPNAEVSFAKDKKTGTLTVTVQATDTNLDLEKSYVSFVLSNDGKEETLSNGGEKKQLNDDGTYTFTLQNGDSLTAMTLHILDKAGHMPDKIEINGATEDVTGGNELSFEQTEGVWKLNGSFQNDQTRPTVSIDVAYEDGKTQNTVGKSVYTNGKAVITVAVDDDNLDAASSEITYRLNDAKELTRIPLSDEKAFQNGKYTLSLEEDAKLSELTVHAEDRYGNPTDKNEDKTIIVDKTAPAVTISIDSPEIAERLITINEKTYIVLKEPSDVPNSEGKRTVTIPITVTVTDSNIRVNQNNTDDATKADDAANFVSIQNDEDKGVTWSLESQSESGIAFKTKITVSEHEIKAIPINLHVSDLAGNKPTGEQSVTCGKTAGEFVYDNGQLDATLYVDFCAPSSIEKIPQITINPVQKDETGKYVPYSSKYTTKDGTELYKEAFAFSVEVSDYGEDASGFAKLAGSVNGENEKSNEDGSGKLIYDISFADGYENNENKFTVTATDQVGNKITCTRVFAFDNQAPRVTVKYDNNDVQKEKFFAKDRTATITVEDQNLTLPDPMKVEAQAAGRIGKCEIGDWTLQDGTYTATCKFSVDDGENEKFTLELSCSDLASNKTFVENGETDGNVQVEDGTAAPWEFVIGKKAPLVVVSYNNNEVQNEKFFVKDRTATIKVMDANCDAAVGEPMITINGEEKKLTLTADNCYEATWEASAAEGEEATFTLEFSYTDPAGNTSSVENGQENGNVQVEADTKAPWEFVIDKKAPVVTVELVENGGACIQTVKSGNKDTDLYDGSISIQITAEDQYLDGSTQSISYTIGGSGKNAGEHERNDLLVKESDNSRQGGDLQTMAGTIELNGLGADGTATEHGDILESLSIQVRDSAGNPAEIKGTLSAGEQETTNDWKNESGTITYTGHYIEVDDTAPTASLEISYTNETDKTSFKPDWYYTRDGVVFAVVDPVKPGAPEAQSVNVTATITMKDANLKSGKPGDENDKHTVRINDNGKLESNSNGKVVYTQEVTVKPNESGLIELDLHVEDMAGNLLKTMKTPGATTTVDGEEYYTDFPEMTNLNGDIQKTISVDRNPTELQGAAILIEADSVVHTGDFTKVLRVREYARKNDLRETNEAENRNKLSGIKRITWKLDAANYVKNEEAAAVKFDGFVQNGAQEIKSNTAEIEKTTATYTQTLKDGIFDLSRELNFALNSNVESNNVTLTITVEDYAQNITTVTRTFKVDNCAPRVNVSYNPETSQRGNEYFNQTRTVAVTVTDLNYETASLSINGEERELTPGEDGISGSMKYTFAADGEYTIELQAKDSVGNSSSVKNGKTEGNVQSTGAAPWHFVIDRTAPVITVSYDNNSSRNGRYYKASRNARISIQETNYDAGNTRGTITATLDGQQISAPALNLAAQNTSVNFSADGDYAMKIDCEDLAGNRATYTGEPFTIDQTAPEVEINVKEYSANTGSITPEITMTDINFDRRGWSAPMQVLSGLNATAKTADWSNSNSTIRHGVRVSYVNLQKSKQNDGVYILTAKVTDLAGNDTTKTVTFSVNRFGSTYVAYDTATQKLLDVGYGKTAPTIKIQEINPNEIRNEKVVLSTGSESVTLKKGTDYTVEATTGKDCWNGALYSVKASVFEKNGKLAEGSYELTFFSEDSANHSNSNRANEAGLPVRFTLDTSAPVVVITGVDNGDRIRAASRDVTLFYSDSSGIKEIIIYLDGKEYLRLSAEELAKHPDSYTFTVDQSNSGRVLSVKVLDAADNEVKTDDIRFFLNSSIFQQYLHNAVLLAITGAVLALAIVLAILLIRRKKRAAHASNT